jgi:hypothetical protein
LFYEFRLGLTDLYMSVLFYSIHTNFILIKLKS